MDLFTRVNLARKRGMKMSTRGIQNCNPGNIRRSKDKWQGLADVQDDSEFFIFKDAIFGIRAMAKIILKYRSYNLVTVEEIINRWAPPSENKTSFYVTDVANRVGVSANEVLKLTDLNVFVKLLKAIVIHENGKNPYMDSIYKDALASISVTFPDPKPLNKSVTIKSSGVSMASTGGYGVIQAVQDTIDPAKDAFMQLSPYLEAAKWALLVITILGICTTIRARINQHKEAHS